MKSNLTEPPTGSIHETPRAPSPPRTAAEDSWRLDLHWPGDEADEGAAAPPGPAERLRARSSQATSPPPEEDEFCGSRRRSYREARCPEFVQVARAALRDKRFCPTTAAVLGLLTYLRDGDVAFARIAGWLRIHASNVSRAASRLRAWGFLDRDNRPADDAPRFDNNTGGALHVPFSEIAQRGLKSAIALCQLRSFPTLRGVRTYGDRSFEVSSGTLGRLLGVTPKTARKRLYELGETVLDVARRAGHAARVRLLGEREQKVPAKVPPKPAPARVSPASKPGPLREQRDPGFVDFTEQVLKRLRHGAPS